MSLHSSFRSSRVNQRTAEPFPSTEAEYQDPLSLLSFVAVTLYVRLARSTISNPQLHAKGPKPVYIPFKISAIFKPLLQLKFQIKQPVIPLGESNFELASRFRINQIF